jgi:nucleotide-binding universal stress UspA family protein
MLAIHTILHPTDFSEGSKCAFGLACALARGYGARLTVLHVVPAATVVYGEGKMPAHEVERSQDAGEERATGPFLTASRP